jgi:hypothetical protein
MAAGVPARTDLPNAGRLYVAAAAIHRPQDATRGRRSRLRRGATAIGTAIQAGSDPGVTPSERALGVQKKQRSRLR